MRVFARIDRFDRFVTALVYVPRDRYTSDVRERVGALLAGAYKGRVAAFYPYFTDGPLVRVQFIVARSDGATPQVETSELEQRVGGIIRTWHDRLVEAIAARGTAAEALLATVRRGLPRRLRRDVPCRARAPKTSRASSGSGRRCRWP